MIRQRILSIGFFSSAILAFAVAVGCVVQEAPPPQQPQPISNEAPAESNERGYGGEGYGGYGYGGAGYGGYGYGGAGYGGYGYGGSGYGGSGYGGGGY